MLTGHPKWLLRAIGQRERDILFSPDACIRYTCVDGERLGSGRYIIAKSLHSNETFEIDTHQRKIIS